MSDLNDMFNQMGPGYTAYNTGVNTAQTQSAAALAQILQSAQIQKLGLANQFTQQNQPTELAQSQANLQSTLGANTKQSLANDFTQQTQQSSIDALNAKNSVAPSAAQAQELQDRMSIFTHMAGQMLAAGASDPSGYGTTGRIAIANQYAKQAPQLVNDPEFDAVIKNPQAALQKYALINASLPSSLSESAKLSQQGANSANVAGIEANAHITAAQIAADSRLQVAEKKITDLTDLQNVAAKYGPRNAATLADTQAAMTDDPDRKAFLLQQRDHYRELVKEANPKPDTPDLNALGIKTTSPGGGPLAPMPGEGPRKDQGAASNVGTTSSGAKFTITGP